MVVMGSIALCLGLQQFYDMVFWCSYLSGTHLHDEMVSWVNFRGSMGMVRVIIFKTSSRCAHYHLHHALVPTHVLILLLTPNIIQNEMAWRRLQLFDSAANTKVIIKVMKGVKAEYDSQFIVGHNLGLCKAFR